ncbi:MAG: GNAT family N-acetyltransferase [Thaumarchaeota archaeon]|nr:GNAT family N-acetyltransferase [Nitrososphaerota archaeon]
MTSVEQVAGLPKGLSFFDPIIPHEAKESLEAGGEVFVSTDQQGKKNGLFIYDRIEATGTIFASSRDVFDEFFGLKPSSYVFSEVDAGDLPRELWNIWQLDVDNATLEHTFRHRVSIDQDAEEIERFMASTQPDTNPRWVRIALKNGDKCFVVKVGSKIVGMAWMSITGSVARSHSLYVEPAFRRKGVMRDDLHARLIYLRSRHVHTLINEIAESNAPSSAHAVKAGEKVIGKIYLYTTPEKKS